MADLPEVGALLWDDLTTTLSKFILEKTGREVVVRLKHVELSAETMTKVLLEITMSNEMTMNSLGLLVIKPDKPKEA